MRKKPSVKSVVLFCCLVFGIFAFQNCGDGFKSLSSNEIDASSGTSATSSTTTLAVNDVNVEPGSPAQIVVSLNQPLSNDLTIDYSTSDGSAVSGSQYNAATGSVVLTAGSLQATIAVVTNQTPGLTYLNKTFFVELTATQVSFTKLVTVTFSSGVADVQLKDQWSSYGSLTSPINVGGGSAVWTGSLMLIWGGYGSGTSGLTNLGSTFNPATQTWGSISGAPIKPRVGQVGVWTGSKMIVWGGETTSDPNTGRPAIFSDGASFDPGSETWQTISTVGAPSPRSYASAVWTGKKMIVWGGANYLIGSGVLYNDGGIYDPSTDSWSSLTSNTPPVGRAGAVAVWTGTNMLVWGGLTMTTTTSGSATTGTFSALNDGYSYDLDSGVWTSIKQSGQIPQPRSGSAFAWTGTQLIIWGGQIQNSNGMSPDGHGDSFLNDGAVYDPVSGLWSAMSASPLAARSLPAAVWTGTQLIIWGGVINAPSPPLDGATYQ